MTPDRTEPRAAPLTVLFVDDEPALVRAISRVIIERTDFNVLTATSGKDALGILRTCAVDVLVSDIDMPQMNGLELVRLARSEFPATLRILLTGGATMERAVNAINEGEVARFFAKPFDPHLFVAQLTELGERVLMLRRERHAEAQRQRCDEFFRWIEESYPGTLAIKRADDGAVVIDAVRLLAYVGSAPIEIRAFVGTG
jgi:DNA-binding NtrC family response regulator